MFRSYDHRISQFYNLLRPHLIPGPYRNEINSFLEGGKVKLENWFFHFSAVDQLPVQGGDFDCVLSVVFCLDGKQVGGRIGEQKGFHAG